ncbi:MAG: hypothetical protein ACKOPH_04475, partial [Methylocystis sp.]
VYYCVKSRDLYSSKYYHYVLFYHKRTHPNILFLEVIFGCLSCLYLSNIIEAIKIPTIPFFAFIRLIVIYCARINHRGAPAIFKLIGFCGSFLFGRGFRETNERKRSEER